MRRFYLFLFVAALGLASCMKSEERKGLNEYPGEWMYNQRAFPDNFINKQALKEAHEMVKTKLLEKAAGTDWQLEGPINIGGRITGVAISPNSDDTLYVCTAVGGVFRTTDRGQNWEPIFDSQGNFSIGAIAIAPSNSQRIYVGTGEANGSANSGAFFGDGIYRSDDGGDSWTHIGLDNSNHIGRIAVDPNNPDRVFAAATGILYGKNNERGLYRTENGGTTWEQVLFVSDSTACIDVALTPGYPDTLYAAMWERIRYPWVRNYGGPTSAVHRSFDGGDTWQVLTNGLPASNSETGKIGLAVSESSPNTVYAVYTEDPITNDFNGLYKSTDLGNTWTDISSSSMNDMNGGFGWYFGNVRVDPTNPNEVYVLGQRLYRTTNGGNSWSSVNGMHVDHHAMEYSRNNPNFILAGNDGGAYISENGGSSWQHFENLPITQFYNIEVDYQLPQRLYGGTQDNFTIRTLSGNLNDWESILEGDGFHVIVDPTDNDYVYAEYQWGNLHRSTNGGSSMLTATSGINSSDRVNWNTPVVLSPFDPQTLYYGSNRLYRSYNRAVSWSSISPDLTDGLHSSGSLAYGTLTTIAASYNNLDVIYTGSDDGNVNVTFDSGQNWTNISASLPKRYVTKVVVHPDLDSTAYVTFSGWSSLDYSPHIFKTTDGGQNWTNISGNLPDIPLNDVLIDHNNNYLFVASDMGVWFSLDEGQNWNILGNDLPMTIVRQLKWHEPTNILYAGTFGRSIYSFDLNTLITVGSETEPIDLSLDVYPNPASDKVAINSNGSTIIAIDIYDIEGKRIDGIQYAQNQIDLTGLADGLYILTIQTNKGSVSKKLLKN